MTNDPVLAACVVWLMLFWLASTFFDMWYTLCGSLLVAMFLLSQPRRGAGEVCPVCLGHNPVDIIGNVETREPRGHTEDCALGHALHGAFPAGPAGPDPVLVALAKRILQEDNDERANEKDWPAGQEWDELAPSSQATFLRLAREEAEGNQDVKYQYPQGS